MQSWRSKIIDLLFETERGQFHNLRQVSGETYLEYCTASKEQITDVRMERIDEKNSKIFRIWYGTLWL